MRRHPKISVKKTKYKRISSWSLFSEFIPVAKNAKNIRTIHPRTIERVKRIPSLMRIVRSSWVIREITFRFALSVCFFRSVKDSSLIF